MWSTLRKDRVVWAGAVALVAEVLLYFLPILPPAKLERFGDFYSGLPLLIVAIAAVRYRLHRIPDPDERRFWSLWSLALSLWLAVYVWYLFPNRWRGVWFDVSEDVTYVGFYLAIILALQVKPHLRFDRTAGTFLRGVEAAGTSIFAFGLLVYLVVIPMALDKQVFFTYIPSLVLYVLLDSLLVLRLYLAQRTSQDLRWRAIYTWLLAAAAAWLVTDSIEVLMTVAIIPWVSAGTPLDLLWLIPLASVIVAARIREHPFAPVALQPNADHQKGSILPALWGDPLIAYAAAFPLIHFVLSTAGVLDPATRSAQEVCAIVLLYVLAGLTVVYQRLLINENRRLEEVRVQTAKAEHRAYHDALTGLPNRYLLLDRLRQALPRARRNRTKVAVFFVDLDRFRVISDSLGPSQSDKVLQAAAERLQRHVRQGDTLARFGGDEFTILVEGIRNAEDTAKIAEKLRESVKMPLLLDGRQLFVTASIGISLYPEDGEDAETLLKNSDAAMSRAKEQGRDTYRLYTSAMNDEALERLRLESSLRTALPLNQFVIQYQPIVDIATGHIDGCEALLRWQHPEKGLLYPGEFIHLAELTGVISAVSPWLLKSACRDAKGWQDRCGQGLFVAVNLSTRHFREPGLVSQVEQALREADLDPSLLELEITESLAMQNPHTAIGILLELKSLGVRIAIDDFGTGYSSLSYLKQFPIDILKIDRCFVQDIHSNRGDSTIAATVIAMASTLGLWVYAEGVEREEQLQVLRQLGCDRVQGYLFSQPLWPNDLEVLLRAGTSLEKLGISQVRHD